MGILVCGNAAPPTRCGRSGSKGEKLSCRRAAAALLQSSLTEEEELQAVLRGNFAAGGAFAALLNTKIAERVWQVLQQFEQKEKLRLPDAGFDAYAIHCTLAVQQRANRAARLPQFTRRKRRTAVRGSFGTGVRPDAADRGSAVFRAVSGSVYHR